MATQRRFTLVTASSVAALLALSGCSMIGGEDNNSEETSSASASSSSQSTSSASASSAESSASSSPSSSETATSSASEDLSENDVMAALNGQNIDGVELYAATGSVMEASGVDITAELEKSMGDVAVKPEKCSDPAKGSLLGGIMQPDMKDGVVAADQGGKLILTVKTFDSVEDAETGLKEFRDAVKDCKQVEMTLDGAAEEAELSDEEITVDGAEVAIRNSLNVQDSVDSPEVHTARMVYGNSLVTAIASSEFEGEEADYEALLGEVVDALEEA